ncbi:lamin tail domain-containing protein [Humisphaera borealis]|uniref:Lamin tail domain-containing protein n=1 Tax=Humisphaera borealis TaxID=2807512 RepID=A0A7M2X1R9_9BACT|nr:lamin tail domain-containing protein [Humisphaera borealis]QOV91706.1 lamin tail domain-containing protein [Humisphaera borealis]
MKVGWKGTRIWSNQVSPTDPVRPFVWFVPLSLTVTEFNWGSMIASGIVRLIRSLSAQRWCAISACIAASGFFSPVAPAAVVINEIYGGGGLAGSPLRNDYVEIVNNGATAFILDNYRLEGAGAALTDWDGITFPAGTSLAPGEVLLVQFGSSGSIGTLLTGTFGTPASKNISATAGKVRLHDGTVGLTAAADAAGILDFVGYATTANQFEVTRAPAGSNQLSISRKVDGVDSNNNGNDFTTTLSRSPGAANVPEPGVLGLAGLLAGLRALARPSRRNSSK